MKTNVLALTVATLTALGGCGGDSGSSTTGGTAGSGGSEGNRGGTGPSFDELFAQGLTKYVSMFDPGNEPEPVGGVKTFRFPVPADLDAEPRGPICLRGAEFTVDTREGDSDALVIFLQGGGACWEDLCAAFEETNFLDEQGGILDPGLEGNPIADWDVVYLPYCDGSLFAGDVDRVLPPSTLGSSTEAGMGYQRGLQNLTAALDVALDEFPNPSRILLTGVSGGAFGTIVALPLVRFYYPDPEILVFNDSGVGVAKEGNPEFINATLLAGWNAESLVPASCPECTSNGHATRLIEWQLRADDNFTMSALSFSEDAVVAVTFFAINPAVFRTSLLAETGRTTSTFVNRYKRFIAAGSAHTVLLRETSDGGGLPIGSLGTEVGGVTALDWFAAHIEGTEDWVDLVDEGLE